MSVNLDERFFAGGGDLPADIRQRTLVTDYHDSMEATLRGVGWEGNLISTVGLTVSADGHLVQSARFCMRGALHDAAIPIKACSIWDGAPKEVSLILTLPDSSAFQFNGGELCSDYLPQSQVKFAFQRDDGTPVSPSEWDAAKLGQFSLRLMAHLDKSSNGRVGPHFRVTVLLFPLSIDALQELSNATQCAAWPGYKILEGKSELFPRAPHGGWGCPIFPIINTCQRAADCTAVPGGDHLRYAIAELMRSAAPPTAHKSKNGLAKAMEEMAADPSLCEPRTPAVVWPAAPRPPASAGRYHTNCIVYPRSTGRACEEQAPRMRLVERLITSTS